MKKIIICVALLLLFTYASAQRTGNDTAGNSESERVTRTAPPLTEPGFLKGAGTNVPLSLTTQDGTGLRLVEFQAKAVIEGPLAFTELSLTFENPEDRILEGRFEITLPDKAAISRFAMLIENRWQEAEVVERQAARRAYEDFLHRRQDPALLEKEAGNEFRARIFPIPAKGRKRLILSYSQELSTGDEPYRLALQGLPEIVSLDLDVKVSKSEGKNLSPESVRIQRKNYRPEGDFVVPQPSEIEGLSSRDFVCARVTPRLTARVSAPRDLLILVDTSASRALGFKSQVKLLTDLLPRLNKLEKITVAAFDQNVGQLYQGPPSKFSGASLLERRALGATDLAKALKWASQQKGHTRLLLITDGISTAGEPDLLESLQSSDLKRLDVIAVGGIRDKEKTAVLVEGALSEEGTLLDGALAPSEIAERLSLSVTSGLDVQIPDAQWIWPSTLNNLQPGDQRLVYAKLQKPKQSLDITVGNDTHRVVLHTLDSSPLLERSAVVAQIARLESSLGKLSSDDDKKSVNDKIIALSTNHRVLSDKTALLVLETEEDYARFKIDRNALADILTVGPNGLELKGREAIVIHPDQVVPEGSLRIEFIVEDAPAAKVIEFLAGEYQRVRFIPHPRANGFYAIGSREDLLQIKRELGNLDRAPEPPDPAAGKSGISSDHRETEHFQDDTSVSQPEAEETRRAPEVQERVPDDILGSGYIRRASVPESAVRMEYLLEEAPAARVMDYLSGKYENVRFVRHPTMNGFYAKGSRDDLLAIRQELANLDRLQDGEQAPEPRPAPERTTTAPTTPAENVKLGDGKSPLIGKLAEITEQLSRGDHRKALEQSRNWQTAEPGNVLALIALGECLEALGRFTEAARAYGSIIDLYPSRADLRRYAGGRLKALPDDGLELAIDTFQKALEQRGDHVSGHRFLALALARQGRYEESFAALEAGLVRSYPNNRFSGYKRVLGEDLGIIGAVWAAKAPEMRALIFDRLKNHSTKMANKPSLRFVLTWETDANDVDFHIYDKNKDHAYYRKKQLASGGELFADVTTGYGPECFSIPGRAQAYPYRLQIHYYRRGPMGYGMGQLEVLQHDGRGGLKFEDRPYIVMRDGAYVDLGVVERPR